MMATIQETEKLKQFKVCCTLGGEGYLRPFLLFSFCFTSSID